MGLENVLTPDSGSVDQVSVCLASSLAWALKTRGGHFTSLPHVICCVLPSLASLGPFLLLLGAKGPLLPDTTQDMEDDEWGP